MATPTLQFTRTDDYILASSDQVVAGTYALLDGLFYVKRDR
jgi:hypothetical protein